MIIELAQNSGASTTACRAWGCPARRSRHSPMSGAACRIFRYSSLITRISSIISFPFSKHSGTIGRLVANFVLARYNYLPLMRGVELIAISAVALVQIGGHARALKQLLPEFERGQLGLFIPGVEYALGLKTSQAGLHERNCHRCPTRPQRQPDRAHNGWQRQ